MVHVDIWLVDIVPRDTEQNIIFASQYRVPLSYSTYSKFSRFNRAEWMIICNIKRRSDELYLCTK
jgi:hypothetical protein